MPDNSPVSLHVSRDRVLVNLRKRLENPKKVMKQIGVLIQNQAEITFEEQRLGRIRWKRRYPNQGEPFINIAAALRRFNQDRNPLSRHFERRPALIGERHLSRSVRTRSNITLMGTHEVQAGTTVPYADDHQKGATTRQPITDTAKKRIAKFIGSKRKFKIKTTTMRPDGVVTQVKTEATGAMYKKKLEPLLNKTELVTKLNPRPMFGLTKQLAEDIVELVESDLPPPAASRNAPDFPQGPGPVLGGART